MAGYDIIAIGASAGGVDALERVVSSLPADLPVSIFIVLHIPAESPSLLPQILSRSGPLPAIHPKNGEAIEQGKIYIAPPDQHMLVEDGWIRIVRGPKENRHRPAIDPLFRSAAVTYGTQVVGVILTGALDDGTAGMLAVKQRGGVAVVQDPDEALYSSMPLSALANVEIDYVLPLGEIGPLLARLAREQAKNEEAYPVPKNMEMETKLAEMDMHALNSEAHTGEPSVFSCPECGGVLWELHDGDLLRFRCRVGHAFSIESMFAGQAEAMEGALWAALKTLEESTSLSRRMARQAHERGQEWLARRFEEKLHEGEHHATLIRQVLVNGQKSGTTDTRFDEAVDVTEEKVVVSKKDLKT